MKVLLHIKKIPLVLLAFFYVCFFSACEKEPIIPEQQPIDLGAGEYLLVGNEGAFGTNTASVSIINLTANTVQNDVFLNKNGQALGDVLQSFTRIGNSYYFVINNSNKILITDTNFNYQTEIQNLLGPRYIKQVSQTRAYVSSIFNDKIYIIDLSSNTIQSQISRASNWTEQMVLASDATGEYLYVCENDTAVNFITKIDVATSQVVDSITIGGYAPSQIGKTSDGHLWVLAGNNFFNKVSTLSEIDLSNNALLRTITFDKKYTTSQMAIGPQDEKYITVVDYNTNKYGVYKIAKNATIVPNRFFVNGPNANYYGVAVNQKNGDVYISDTKGFTQAGDVNRYSSQGEFLSSWTVGLGPSSFYFAP